MKNTKKKQKITYFNWKYILFFFLVFHSISVNNNELEFFVCFVKKINVNQSDKKNEILYLKEWKISSPYEKQ